MKSHLKKHKRNFYNHFKEWGPAADLVKYYEVEGKRPARRTARKKSVSAPVLAGDTASHKEGSAKFSEPDTTGVLQTQDVASTLAGGISTSEKSEGTVMDSKKDLNSKATVQLPDSTEGNKAENINKNEFEIEQKSDEDVDAELENANADAIAGILMANNVIRSPVVDSTHDKGDLSEKTENNNSEESNQLKEVNEQEILNEEKLLETEEGKDDEVLMDEQDTEEDLLENSEDESSEGTVIKPVHDEKMELDGLDEESMQQSDTKETDVEMDNEISQMEQEENLVDSGEACVMSEDINLQDISQGNPEDKDGGYTMDDESDDESSGYEMISNVEDYPINEKSPDGDNMDELKGKEMTSKVVSMESSTDAEENMNVDKNRDEEIVKIKLEEEDAGTMEQHSDHLYSVGTSFKELQDSATFGDLDASVDRSEEPSSEGDSSEVIRIGIPPGVFVKQEKIEEEVYERLQNEDMSLSQVKEESDAHENAFSTNSMSSNIEQEIHTPDGKVITVERSGFALPGPPPAPEKPLSPLTKYTSKIWDEVKNENPALATRELTLTIKDKWENLNESEKEVYEDEFEQEQEEYRKARIQYHSLPEYKSWLGAKEALESAMSCKMKASIYQDKKTIQDYSSVVGPCNWCKKISSLKNFRSDDGTREVYCTGLCSLECFEGAEKQIRETEPGKKGPRYEPSVPLEQLANRDISSIPSSVVLKNNPFSNFSWDRYLAETNSAPAPWACFRQAMTPPMNGFQVGMAVEAVDPRSVSSSVCLAYVKGVLGPRIKLRFEDCDASADIWRLADSDDIHPLGWCEGHGGMLQPPIGFRHDAGRFSVMMASKIAQATSAPTRLFKREPPSPPANMFEKGMKLEAVDRKNPAMICVASVNEVIGEQIRIEFDGWRGADYWCRYDSRDIFPVGWCYIAGYPLQPPGKNYKPPCKDTVEKKRKFKLETQGQVPVSPTMAARTPSPVSESIATQTHKHKSPSSSKVATGGESPDKPDPPKSSTVKIFLNVKCRHGPYLNPMKLRKLPKKYSGGVVNVTRESIQDLVNSAWVPRTVLGLLKAGDGKIKIFADGFGKKNAYNTTLRHVDRVSIFWKVIDQFVESLRCCENLICGEKIDAGCPLCGDSGGDKGKGSKVPGKRTTEDLPEQESKAKKAKKDLQTSRKSTGPKKSKEQKEKGKAAKSPATETESPAMAWSVDEVVEYIQQTDLKEYAELFKTNEIDGRAFLLLTRDLIMNYLGLKLGPAIKLVSLIDEMKPTPEEVDSD